MGFHALLQEDLPDPGIEPASPTSPALVGGFFPTSTTWEAHLMIAVVCKVWSQASSTSIVRMANSCTLTYIYGIRNCVGQVIHVFPVPAGNSAAHKGLGTLHCSGASCTLFFLNIFVHPISSSCMLLMGLCHPPLSHSTSKVCLSMD